MVKLLCEPGESAFEDYLILQFGSAFLGAETLDSDFDIVLVVPFNRLGKFSKTEKSVR